MSCEKYLDACEKYLDSCAKYLDAFEKYLDNCENHLGALRSTEILVRSFCVSRYLYKVSR